MDEFEKLANNIGKIDLVEIFIESVKDFENEIIELNTKGQLGKGITKKGENIRPAYAESTKKQRRKLGLQTSRVDLKVNGGYWRSYKMLTSKKDVTVTSFLEVSRGFNLSEFFRKKYGEIEGLTDKHEEDILNKIYPIFVNKVNKIIDG